MPDSLNFRSFAVTLVTSAAQLITGIDPQRSYLAIQNTGISALSIGFSSAPTAAGLGLTLDPASAPGSQGGSWEWIEAVPNNSIYLYSAGGTTATVVTG